jgi:hypothetical protein
MGNCQLMQIVLTRRLARRFARGLHGRQQQRNENADDGDDDEQFDESKATYRRSAEPRRKKMNDE